MVYRTQAYDILNPLPMVYWIPCLWYFDPLPKICRTTSLWDINPPTHCISDPSMVYWTPPCGILTPNHGELNPLHVEPHLPIVFRTHWLVFWPPTHGILKYLPMVFWSPYPRYYSISNRLHKIYRTHYPWYVETALLWYFTPLPIIYQTYGLLNAHTPSP